jgi:CDP-diacylglycerol--glycerol-3-phosphate 3-phosphatidyltransferase
LIADSHTDKADLSIKSATRIQVAIPNLLSLSRVLISPFVFIAVKDDRIGLIIAFASWAMLSDYLDGLLARKWDVISNAGKILDPLADKLCIAAAAIALTLYGDFPLLLTFIIIGRDIFISLFGLAISKKIKYVPGSNMTGKIAATVLAIILLIYIFKVESLYSISYITAVFFIILSSVSYLALAYRFISNKN